MLAIPHLTEIEQHLGRLPALADAVESRGMRLYGDVREWIKGAEAILHRYSMVQAGDLAVIRTELAAAARAPQQAAGVPAGRARSRRARSEQAAAEALAKAARVVEGAVTPSRQLVQEGERIARQIAAVAKAKGLPPATGDWAAVTAAWEQAAADRDLVSPTTHLVGLVGRVNAMLLYMRTTSQI